MSCKHGRVETAAFEMRNVSISTGNTKGNHHTVNVPFAEFVFGDEKKTAAEWRGRKGNKYPCIQLVVYMSRV